MLSCLSETLLSLVIPLKGYFLNFSLAKVKDIAELNHMVFSQSIVHRGDSTCKHRTV